MTSAYLFQLSPPRYIPLMGGDPLFVGVQPGSYPVDYGAAGTYRPGRLTAGVPAGTAMTAYNGNLTASTAGATYDSIEFFGKVSITAANVTFTRCIFHGKAGDNFGNIIQTSNAGCVNAQFIDCTIAPLDGMIGMSGIAGHDFTALRCEFANLYDPIDPYNTNVKDADSHVVIDRCWMHDFAYWLESGGRNPNGDHTDGQSHNDGIQIQGCHKVTVVGNSIEAYYGPFGDYQISNTANPTPAGWTNPDLTCLLLNTSTSLGTTQLHTVTDNWLLGGFVPCNLGGAGAGVNLGTWQRNKFSGDSWMHTYAGITDPITIWMRSDQTIDAGEGDPVNQNTYMDGTPIRVHRNG
jgi:hypothetical protein